MVFGGVPTGYHRFTAIGNSRNMEGQGGLRSARPSLPLRPTRVHGVGEAHRLLDDLVRPRQQRLRDHQPERLRGLEVDHQLKFGGLLDGKIARLGPLEDLVDVASSTSLHLGSIYSIGHETAWLNKHLELIDCGDPMRGRKIEDGLSMHEHEGWRRHHYTLVVILLHAEESGSQIPRSAHDERMNL